MNGFIITLLVIGIYFGGFLLTLPPAGRFFQKHSGSHNRRYGISRHDMPVIYFLSAIWPFTMWVYLVAFIGRQIGKIFRRFNVTNEGVVAYINRTGGVKP